MNKKIIAGLISFFLITGCLSSCAPDEGEKPSAGSNEEAVTIRNTIDHAEEMISLAEAAKAAATPEGFESILDNPDAKAASYYGPHDIIVKREAHIDKMLSIRTTGKVEINSSCKSVVLLGADGGFTSAAATDTIIIKGENINADIKADCGEIHITGKNTTVHIHEGTVSQITARNTTAVICNHTNAPVSVVLTNGSVVNVDGGHSYQLKDNLVTKGLTEK